MEVADRNGGDANPCQSELATSYRYVSDNGHTIGVEPGGLPAGATLHMADAVEALQRRRRSSGGGSAIHRSASAAPSSRVVLEIEHVGLCLRDFDLPLFSRREKASRTLRALALRKMKTDAEAKNARRRSSLQGVVTPAMGVQQAIQAMHPPFLALRTSDALRDGDDLLTTTVGAHSAGLHEGAATIQRRMRRRRASDPLPPNVPMAHMMSVGSAADSTVTFALPGMLPPPQALAQRGAALGFGASRAGTGDHASGALARVSSGNYSDGFSRPEATGTTGMPPLALAPAPTPSRASTTGAGSPAGSEPSPGVLGLKLSGGLTGRPGGPAPHSGGGGSGWFKLPVMTADSRVVSRTQAQRHQFIDTI